MKIFRNSIFFIIITGLSLFFQKTVSGQETTDKNIERSYLQKYRNFPINWWEKYGKMDSSWFASDGAVTIADNIISWQTEAGGWPLMNTTREPWTGDETAIGPWGRHGTFIYATTNEIRFLARVYNATGIEKYKESLLKGINYIFTAQTPTGGWPKSFPVLNEDYHRYITFNDGAMINVMMLLKEMIEEDDYNFLGSEILEQIKDRYELGIECILNCQIITNGKLTAWCQQHDEVTYKPRPGRTFEPAAISGSESVGVIKFLMQIDNPSYEIKQSVKSAVSWFNESKIEGIRVVTIPDSTFEQRKIDRKVINDSGPVLWARYYEIETNLPVFYGRDGVKKYNLAEIDQERRTGYAWYGTWAEGLTEDYRKWTAKW